MNETRGAPEWPLVGRSRELEHVRALLKGRARGVVLAGYAGVGKTRLGRECLVLAAQEGYATSVVTATRAASGVPFGAFSPLLPALDVGTLGPLQQAELLRRSAGALLKGASARLALLVDDAHVLDEVSATLTHQLAATYDVFVVATVRLGEPCPDSIVALWKDGDTERLDLAPLGPSEVEALVLSALGGPLEAGSLHYLVTRSAGNGQYLQELVVGAMDTGSLRQVEGVWRLVDHSPASARLVELVEARLGRLSDRERAVVEMLSYGEPVGRSAVSQLADDETLEALERRGLLSVVKRGRRTEIRLAHPLHADVIRVSVGPLRAASIRAALADVVEQAGARRKKDLLQLATWRLELGRCDDAQLMLAAGRQAAVLGDLRLAERLGLAACEARAGFEAALLVAQVVGMAGRWEEAEHRLTELAADTSNDVQRMRVALAQIDNLALGRTRRDEAVRVAEEAEAAVSDSELREVIMARRASLLFCNGRTAEALELVEPVMAARQGLPLVWACVLGTVALALQGRIDAAVTAADRALAAHATLAGPPLMWEQHALVMFRAHALGYAGRLDEAEEAGRRAYDDALVDSRHSIYAWVLARIALARGRVGTALAFAREAVSLTSVQGFPRVLRWVMADLVHALALSGRVEEAVATVAKLDAMPVEIDAPYRGHELQARAWAAVAAGEHGEGRALLEEAAHVAADIGTRYCEAMALHDLARLGHAAGVTGRLATLAAEVDGRLVGAWADHADALAGDDAERLTRASSTFEGLGALLSAAEAAAGAAAALRRAGCPRPAAAQEVRAAGLARRCEGAMTPALMNVETHSLLGARELEVASLAAAGMPNREIAATLHLSVRTVESQLQRAYEKLGIRRRSALAQALSPGWDAER